MCDEKMILRILFALYRNFICIHHRLTEDKNDMIVDLSYFTRKKQEIERERNFENDVSRKFKFSNILKYSGVPSLFYTLSIDS